MGFIYKKKGNEMVERVLKEIENMKEFNPHYAIELLLLIQTTANQSFH